MNVERAEEEKVNLTAIDRKYSEKIEEEPRKASPTAPKELPEPKHKCTYHLNPKGPSPHHHTNKFEVKKIYDNVTETIGNTPMIRLNNIPKNEGVKAEFLVKCEFFNPGGSLKDRIGLKMIQDAELDGKMKKGDTLVEPTSGNTGVGLAMACIVYGYNMIFTLPDKVSYEKTDLINALGAKTIRRPTELEHNNPDSYTGTAKKMAKQPNHFELDQYNNASNAVVHYDTTAEEIIASCEDKLDYVFLCVGTGGTATGIGRKVKERFPNCKIIGCDPKGSDLALPGTLNTDDHPFFVEGAGGAYVPLCADRKVIDHWVKVDDAESFSYARKMIKEEGLLAGGSSGTILAGAMKYAKEFNLPADARCVVICPDSARNYMSKFVSDEWMIENGFLPPDTLDTENHILNDVMCDQVIFKDLPINDPTLTVADALEQLSGDVEVIAILDGIDVKVVTAAAMNNAICSGLIKGTDRATLISTTEFPCFMQHALTLAQLEVILRRSPFVILQALNAGVITGLLYVTPRDVTYLMKQKIMSKDAQLL